MTDDARLLAVSAEARAHILERHRYGAPEGKSKFPRTWTDDDIIAAVETVANDPASGSKLQPNDNRALTGVWRGTTLTVIVANSGQVITAYPKRR